MDYFLAILFEHAHLVRAGFLRHNILVSYRLHEILEVQRMTQTTSRE